MTFNKAYAIIKDMTISTTTQRYELAGSGNERFQLGEVVATSPIAAEEVNILVNKPKQVWRVEINDAYVSNYSLEEQIVVRQDEIIADGVARNRREEGLWARNPGTVYFDANGDEVQKETWGDPYSGEIFFTALGSPAMNVWRSLIPSAKALAYLSEPQDQWAIASKDGTLLETIDPEAKKWFTLCTDAIGIRSRATVMSKLIKGFADERAGDGDPVRWMSVASGTALPTIQAAIAADVDHKTKLLLVDLDRAAMEATKQLASEVGFDGTVEQRRANVFDSNAMQRLRDELEAKDELPEVIDMMGIFEYTGVNLGVNPTEFLKSCYSFLKPGGRLVFGQMRTDRPVSDFTMGVVGWPFVHTRTPSEFMDVIVDAGIPAESVSLYLPTDGVYTIGAIDKPTQ